MAALVSMAVTRTGVSGNLANVLAGVHPTICRRLSAFSHHYTNTVTIAEDQKKH